MESFGTRLSSNEVQAAVDGPQQVQETKKGCNIPVGWVLVSQPAQRIHCSLAVNAFNIPVSRQERQWPVGLMPYGLVRLKAE